MCNQTHPKTVFAAFLLILGAGCCPPAAFHVETVVHPDGSCDRLIWQPKKGFLPDEALRPAWNQRWKTVEDAPRPPEPAKPGASADRCAYFMARGSFRSPGDIPAHYRYVDEKFPSAGASEIERTYRRMDYGFAVEYRWEERITNIVTLPDFLRARDELLDLFLPAFVDDLEREFAGAYDISGLVAYIRIDGRRFLEQAAIALYDVAARHTSYDELVSVWADVTGRFGLDLRDEESNVVSQDEAVSRLEEFFRRLITKHVRHRNGDPLTEPEVDAILSSTSQKAGDKPAAPRGEDQAPRRLERVEDQLGPILLRMTGLYNPLAFLFQGGVPQYEFTLQLPGQLIETNGMIATSNRASWKFTSNELFPTGYQMKARSVVLDVDAQKKILGRVVIPDGLKALELMELVDGDSPLLEAVRKVRETADLSALRDFQTTSVEQYRRVKKLRELMLPR